MNNLAIVAVLLLGFIFLGQKSNYTKLVMAPVQAKPSGPAAVSGPAVASSLLPKVSQDPSKFDPKRLLQGQSFIHGVPGSVVGSLRNANQQVRSDPPIPRKPVSIFNQSTIPTDTMQRQLNIGGVAR